MLLLQPYKDHSRPPHPPLPRLTKPTPQFLSMTITDHTAYTPHQLTADKHTTASSKTAAGTLPSLSADPTDANM